MRSRVTTSIRRVVRGRSSGRVRAVWRVLFPVLAVFLGLSLPAAAARAMGAIEGAAMVAGFVAATLVVLGVESAAAGAWNPAHGVPMLAATVAAAVAVAAWSYVRRGGRSARPVGLGAEGRADR